MELLYELESQADELIVERMRQTIADALSRYKSMSEKCDVAMERHHSYKRTLITNVQRDAAGHPCVSPRRRRRNDRRDGWHRQRTDAKDVFQKIRDEACGARSELRARGQDAEARQKYAVQMAEIGRIQASQDV